MKRLLLAGCVFLVGGYAAPVMADSIKPGQRMIYDDRAPEEPSQLGKPIFKKRIVAPTVPREEPAEGKGLDKRTNSPDDDPDTTESQTSDNKNEPSPVYVAPRQSGNNDATDSFDGITNEDGEIDFESFSPQKNKKIKKTADDAMKNMPHKNLTQEQLVNMTPEDRERVHKEIKAYTDKYGEQIKKELAD